ncbi:MAG: hypothetical protein ABL921_12700 [Pirellula sp.]
MAKKKKHLQSTETELSEINVAAGNLMERAFCATAFQMYSELRSKARAEGQLGYYVIGTFFQMNLAQRMLQFETVRERAVELIAIFENEEQARKIEPSLDLDQYEGMIYSMGACAYEVLAEATGDLDGFKSEGMQECLTGGIEVCHRIGKLGCLQCFREYACDIHTAADDYELARYHCNQVLQNVSHFAERGDRRWLAMLRLANMDILEGQHDSGRAKLEQATELAGASSVNDPNGAGISVMFERYALDIIEGHAMDDRTAATIQCLPPRGECPEYDLEIDCLAAMGFVMNRKWDEAEELLIGWNKSLKRSNAITKWLETGIRLVALYRIRGDTTKAKRLAVQFEEAATKANDWQSIRRLHQCLDDSTNVTPLGTVIRNTRASSSVPHPEPDSLTQGVDYPSIDGPTPKVREVTPLSAWLDDVTSRIQDASTNAESQGEKRVDVSTFRRELMNRDFAEYSHPEDIGRALYIMNILVTPDANRVEIWKWANRMVSRHQDIAYLISLLGRLGMTISLLDRLTDEINKRGLDSLSDLDEDHVSRDDLEKAGVAATASITNERLEQLIRKSLQMDSAGVNNNFRAAEVFEYIGNDGEAERCYARAFKLDRTRDDAALALSRIYAESDRIQDALYVLDLCIRAGGSSQELLFEAALKAQSLTQYELQVSFLNKLHDQFGPAPWTNYYLSAGLLELKRPFEAMEAIRAEVAKFQSHGLHIDSVRAAALAQLGQSAAAIVEIEKCLAYKLSRIDDLTLSGISGAFERMIAAAKSCPNERAIQARVEERMLKIGIATESYFEQIRAHEKPCDLYLFQCYLSQPLDENWPDHEGCLHEQIDWDYYVTQWGVLARDSEEAADVALKWQLKCYPEEAIVISVEGGEQPLHDRPGIAFQGPRFPDMDEDDDDDEDEDDDDDDGDHGDDSNTGSDDRRYDPRNG